MVAIPFDIPMNYKLTNLTLKYLSLQTINRNRTKMNLIKTMTLACGIAVLACSCQQKCNEAEEFKYSVDQFADLQILRYRIPGWDSLSLDQKAYIYELSEAAKCGRDILFDQNFKYNIKIRKTLEAIIEANPAKENDPEWDKFMVYAKRVFFSSGIHHHYSEDKFFPECSKEYFEALLDGINYQAQPSEDCSYQGNELSAEELLDVIYNPETYLHRRYPNSDKDILLASATNLYDGSISKKEAEEFYAKMEDPKDERPVAYGLNSRLAKVDGNIVEQVYCSNGLYGNAINAIISHLEKAKEHAQNDMQRKAISELVEYYTTGSLQMWDQYNITWVQDTLSIVDFVNGFIEDYCDPMGRKAAWESSVNFKDVEASRRTEIISANAQWFEDNSPINPEFKKKEVKGVSAKVITVACIGGECFPATPIGINLPNSNWIRKEYGSKSVTIANITDAYNKAADENPKSVTNEFYWDENDIAMLKKYKNITSDLHTDLHECLGHGSGQLLPGVSPNALGEYNSTLEEARADLFGLYYLADPKMVELGIVPDAEAYKAEYLGQMVNGLFTQFARVELGRPNTESHMQDRKLIAQWCYENGLASATGAKEDVIEQRFRDGKRYFVINNYEALRELFGKLLAEIQRIKSEGDYKAGKNLVETYAINIDPELHKEVRERYASLEIKPYKGFINPTIRPVEKNGEIVDYEVVYNNDYLAQMMELGSKYSFL